MDSPEQNAAHADLERFIHEQLRKLPEHEAPADLISNVMKVVAERRNLPWWKQPFTAWPKQNQMLLFASLAVMLGGVTYLAWSPAEQLTAASLAQKARPFGWLTSVMETIAGSFLLAVRNLPWSWLAVIASIFMLLYTACVAAGLALFRITAHRRFSLR